MKFWLCTSFISHRKDQIGYYTIKILKSMEIRETPFARSQFIVTRDPVSLSCVNLTGRKMLM